MVRSSLAALATLVCSLAACTADNPEFVGNQRACGEGESYVADLIELPSTDQVDLLFIVDNSPGMLGIQTNAARAIPNFLSTLSDNGIDWRVAVTTTDLFDHGGALVETNLGEGGCPTDNGLFIEADEENAESLAACKLLQGQAGSERAQGLSSARLALESEGGAEFVRPDARLMLVFVSAGDDCSHNGQLDTSAEGSAACYADDEALIPVSDYQIWFQNYAKPGIDSSAVQAAAIIGPSSDQVERSAESVCRASGRPVLGGFRYRELVEGMSSTGTLASICSDVSFHDQFGAISAALLEDQDLKLCMQVNITRAPEFVQVLENAESSAGVELNAGDDYYLAPPSQGCEEGYVVIDRDAHDDVVGHSLNVWFCTDDATS